MSQADVNGLTIEYDVRGDGLTCIFAVRPLGFEPRTNGLRVHCSAIELEAHRDPCRNVAARKCMGRRGAPDTSGLYGVSEGT